MLASQNLLMEFGSERERPMRIATSNSRRTLPTHLSAIPFCQGLRKAVRRGSIPIWSIALVTLFEKIESLS